MKRRKRKEASESERWEQSGSRRSVIYHAPRGSPIVSASLLSLPHPAAASLLPTDRSSHPFPSLAHGEPSSHGDPVVREPHCNEGPGERLVTSVPVSLFLFLRSLLIPSSCSTLGAVSRRSLYLLLPLRTAAASLFLFLSLPMSPVLLSRITPRRDRVLSPLAPSTYVYIADTCEHVHSHVRTDVRAFSRIWGG